MYSKKILKDDIQDLEKLERQRAKCASLIKSSYEDILLKDLTREELDAEKSMISALEDQYNDLDREISIVHEQMYLNFTNNITITQPNTPTKDFPHINTIDS